MKAFVDWVLAQRARLVIVAVVAAPLLSVVSSALIALETARRGTFWGVVSGAGLVAGLAALAFLSRTDAMVFTAMGAVCALTGVGIGGLIQRAGNLVLAFQAAVLFCFALVLAVGVIGLDARMLFGTAVDELVALLPPETSREQVAFVQDRMAAILLAAAAFLQVMGTLLLGSWWASLAAGQRRFGAEFRQLRLGRVLGVTASALFVVALVFAVPVVQNLALLAVLAFVLQGVAVLHAWAHSKKWHPALLVPLYLGLLMPGLNVLIVLPISVVGLVDQWFDLRASMRPRS